MDVTTLSTVFLFALAGHCMASDTDFTEKDSQVNATWLTEYTACLDSTYHKRKPGPESSLYGHCTPWKNEACCTENTTRDVHHTAMYGFSLDFCEEQTGQKMRDVCKKHFHRDLCFYECEPNIGPWVVKVKRKLSRERFFEAPLCESDCNTWWQDCRFEYACTPNWPRGFKFGGGKNSCPKDSKCVPFHEMYKNASDFCSQVWDHSWRVVPDDRPCMRLWFDGSMGNPNKRVALLYGSHSVDRNGFPSGAEAVASSSLQLFIFGAMLTTLLS
ncbi:folate receptor gamma isoform X2 [Ixodes scapularis]|uniref:folate receptor gamma isoform X2 n=1 Tax=Ixodes scapularis TaxID=6945 RepID=UPI001A9D7DC1|nr:folate receptor gamma isoform X2 [Ixodes scapularis]